LSGLACIIVMSYKRRDMQFSMVIHKNPETDYGVAVPDLPGCFSAGSSLDEALANAVEAIELHVDGMLSDYEAIPLSQKIENHQRNPDYADGIWKTVIVDVSKLKREHNNSKGHIAEAVGA